MLFKPSDTFLIEALVQLGRSHDDAIDKTRKFHAVQRGMYI